MKLALLAYTMAIFCCLIPASSLATGTLEDDPGPENGCVFAQHVLDEIDKEEVRIRFERERANQALRVVLTVQLVSGENLRRSTNDWIRQHCIKPQLLPPRHHPRPDHRPEAGLAPRSVRHTG